jgi:hypothetical protein
VVVILSLSHKDLFVQCSNYFYQSIKCSVFVVSFMVEVGGLFHSFVAIIRNVIDFIIILKQKT